MRVADLEKYLSAALGYVIRSPRRQLPGDLHIRARGRRENGVADPANHFLPCGTAEPGGPEDDMDRVTVDVQPSDDPEVPQRDGNLWVFDTADGIHHICAVEHCFHRYTPLTPPSASTRSARARFKAATAPGCSRAD